MLSPRVVPEFGEDLGDFLSNRTALRQSKPGGLHLLDPDLCELKGQALGFEIFLLNLEGQLLRFHGAAVIVFPIGLEMPVFNVDDVGRQALPKVFQSASVR